jgi:3-oxoacyl-[acyl-carrier-protein] synthase II
MDCKSARRRVVVTGIGMVTPLANTREETWRKLLACENGIGPITHFDSAEFSVHIAGEVKDFDPTQFMDRKDARRYDRFVHFAVAAAREAVADSGVNMDAVERERFGCVIGSGIGGIRSCEDLEKGYLERGVKKISPLTIPKIMVNCACGQVAIELGLKGVNYSPVSACASGSHSTGLALRHIQWGEAEMMLAGGAEAGITVLGLGGFSNMTALSTRNDDPATASRPFDKDRDGFVIGEGAGVVMLEELEHARVRGARIYAEVLGYGFTDDAFHITAPDESADGGTRAMGLALRDSGRTPADVDYVNAHGTSTPYNDKIESAAIKKALGEDAARKVKINSTKSMTGHLLGAAGGIESGVVALSIHEGRIHGTRNYQTPDPECDLDYAVNGAEELAVGTALSNSLGFGGHNATICFGRYEE